jgi:predicted Fe-S protein YdhL (DUF1289 family)
MIVEVKARTRHEIVAWPSFTTSKQTSSIARYQIPQRGKFNSLGSSVSENPRCKTPATQKPQAGFILISPKTAIELHPQEMLSVEVK